MNVTLTFQNLRLHNDNRYGIANSELKTLRPFSFSRAGQGGANSKAANGGPCNGAAPSGGRLYEERAQEAREQARLASLARTRDFAGAGKVGSLVVQVDEQKGEFSPLKAVLSARRAAAERAQEVAGNVGGVLDSFLTQALQDSEEKPVEVGKLKAQIEAVSEEKLELAEQDVGKLTEEQLKIEAVSEEKLELAEQDVGKLTEEQLKVGEGRAERAPAAAEPVASEASMTPRRRSTSARAPPSAAAKVSANNADMASGIIRHPTVTSDSRCRRTAPPKESPSKKKQQFTLDRLFTRPQLAELKCINVPTTLVALTIDALLVLLGYDIRASTRNPLATWEGKRAIILGAEWKQKMGTLTIGTLELSTAIEVSGMLDVMVESGGAEAMSHASKLVATIYLILDRFTQAKMSRQAKPSQATAEPAMFSSVLDSPRSTLSRSSSSKASIRSSGKDSVVATRSQSEALSGASTISGNTEVLRHTADAADGGQHAAVDSGASPLSQPADEQSKKSSSGGNVTNGIHLAGRGTPPIPRARQTSSPASHAIDATPESKSTTTTPVSGVENLGLSLAADNSVADHAGSVSRSGSVPAVGSDRVVQRAALFSSPDSSALQPKCSPRLSMKERMAQDGVAAAQVTLSITAQTDVAAPVLAPASTASAQADMAAPALTPAPTTSAQADVAAAALAAASTASAQADVAAPALAAAPTASAQADVAAPALAAASSVSAQADVAAPALAAAFTATAQADVAEPALAAASTASAQADVAAPALAAASTTSSHADVAVISQTPTSSIADDVIAQEDLELTKDLADSEAGSSMLKGARGGLKYQVFGGAASVAEESDGTSATASSQRGRPDDSTNTESGKSEVRSLNLSPGISVQKSLDSSTGIQAVLGSTPVETCNTTTTTTSNTTTTSSNNGEAIDRAHFPVLDQMPNDPPAKKKKSVFKKIQKMFGIGSKSKQSI
ncbi:hypothetical protein CYMTET_10274 [Cymbomonas tetramitiformis]|uniref:Uncharacterized protein n=1 Tax=Cymbomonas tetramitiformis TaxID=36881 RepID=A0AAE0GPV4_9CHLO|nr:hypothetical protein CYMTET_10274 [Cymbomonas tetramitiformis]